MPFKRYFNLALIGVFFVCVTAPFQASFLFSPSNNVEPVVLEGPTSISNQEVGIPAPSRNSNNNNNGQDNTSPMKLPRTEVSKVAVDTTVTHHQDSVIKPRLWLHVDAISEGMANWRIGFVELLLAAKEIGAYLVEPCVLQGKVTSCHKIANQNKLRVGQVFDLNKLRREIHPWIISQEEYEAATTPSIVDPKNVFIFCMHHGSPPASVLCNRGGKLLDNYHGAKTNDAIEQALQQSEPAVLDIHTYRKRGFAETKLQKHKRALVNSTLVQQILEDNLAFHPSHYETVSGFLKQMGIQDNNYNALHWRAELRGTNYPECAEKLIKSKSIMSQNNETIPTILISSLNQQAWLQWGAGGGSSGTAQRSVAPALASLLSNGFLKLDTIKGKKVTDMLYLAVWDQILAQRANKFATCTKACNKKHACSLCNYRGSFGEVVMGMRKKIGKESLTCWPTK